jgi:hypothetical protein
MDYVAYYNNWSEPSLVIQTGFLGASLTVMDALIVRGDSTIY